MSTSTVLLPPVAQAAAILARMTADSPPGAAGVPTGSPLPAALAPRRAIPAQLRSVESPSHRQTRGGIALGGRPSDSFGVVGYGLFAFQQTRSLTNLPTMEQALAARPSRREESRADAPRVDAFAMLGEIGFLDI